MRNPPPAWNVYGLHREKIGEFLIFMICSLVVQQHITDKDVKLPLHANSCNVSSLAVFSISFRMLRSIFSHLALFGPPMAVAIVNWMEIEWDCERTWSSSSSLCVESVFQFFQLQSQGLRQAATGESQFEFPPVMMLLLCRPIVCVIVFNHKNTTWWAFFFASLTFHSRRTERHTKWILNFAHESQIDDDCFVCVGEIVVICRKRAEKRLFKIVSII